MLVTYIYAVHVRLGQQQAYLRKRLLCRGVAAELDDALVPNCSAVKHSHIAHGRHPGRVAAALWTATSSATHTDRRTWKQPRTNAEPATVSICAWKPSGTDQVRMSELEPMGLIKAHRHTVPNCPTTAQ